MLTCSDRKKIRTCLDLTGESGYYEGKQQYGWRVGHILPPWFGCGGTGVYLESPSLLNVKLGKRGRLYCLNYLGPFPRVLFGIASTCQTLNHQELHKVGWSGRAAEPQTLPLYRTFWNCLFSPINLLECGLAPKTSLLLLPFSCQLSPADWGSENQTETTVPCAGPGRSFLVSSPDIGEITTVSAATAFWALWGNLLNDLEFLHSKNRAASFGQKLFSCRVLSSLFHFILSPPFPACTSVFVWRSFPVPASSIRCTLATLFFSAALLLWGAALLYPFSSSPFWMLPFHLKSLPCSVSISVPNPGVQSPAVP